MKIDWSGPLTRCWHKNFAVLRQLYRCDCELNYEPGPSGWSYFAARYNGL